MFHGILINFSMDTKWINSLESKLNVTKRKKIVVVTHHILLLHLIRKNFYCLIHWPYAPLPNFSIYIATIYFITSIITVCWWTKPLWSSICIVITIQTEMLMILLWYQRCGWTARLVLCIPVYWWEWEKKIELLLIFESGRWNISDE